MNSINYPNKTFVFEKTYDHHFGTTTQIVIIAASDKETAIEYIKEKLEFSDVTSNDITWLMDVNYKTIYDQNGFKPSEKQVRILYSTGIHYKS